MVVISNQNCYTIIKSVNIKVNFFSIFNSCPVFTILCCEYKTTSKADVNSDRATETNRVLFWGAYSILSNAFE